MLSSAGPAAVLPEAHTDLCPCVAWCGACCPQIASTTTTAANTTHLYARSKLPVGTTHRAFIMKRNLSNSRHQESAARDQVQEHKAGPGGKEALRKKGCGSNNL